MGSCGSKGVSGKHNSSELRNKSSNQSNKIHERVEDNRGSLYNDKKQTRRKSLEVVIPDELEDDDKRALDILNELRQASIEVIDAAAIVHVPTNVDGPKKEMPVASIPKGKGKGVQRGSAAGLKVKDEPIDILDIMQIQTKTESPRGPSEAAIARAERQAASLAAQLGGVGRRSSGQSTVILTNLDVSDAHAGNYAAPNSPEYDINAFSPVPFIRKPNKDLNQKLESDIVEKTQKIPHTTKSQHTNDLMQFDYGEKAQPTSRRSSNDVIVPKSRRASNEVVLSPSFTSKEAEVNPKIMKGNSIHSLAQAHREEISKEEAAKLPIIAPMLLSLDAEQEERDKIQEENEANVERERRRSLALTQQAEYERRLKFHNGVPLDNLTAPWNRRASAPSLKKEVQDSEVKAAEALQLEAYQRADLFVSVKTQRQKQKERYEQLLREQNTRSVAEDATRRASMPNLGRSPDYHPFANLMREPTNQNAYAQPPRPEGQRLNPSNQRRGSLDDKLSKIIMDAQAAVRTKYTQPSVRRSSNSSSSQVSEEEDENPGPTQREIKHRLMASVLGIRKPETSSNPQRHSSNNGSSSREGKQKEARKSSSRLKTGSKDHSESGKKSMREPPAKNLSPKRDYPAFDFEDM